MHEAPAQRANGAQPPAMPCLALRCSAEVATKPAAALPPNLRRSLAHSGALACRGAQHRGADGLAGGLGAHVPKVVVRGKGHLARGAAGTAGAAGQAERLSGKTQLVGEGPLPPVALVPRRRRRLPPTHRACPAATAVLLPARCSRLVFSPTLKTDLVEPPAIQDRPLMALASAPMGRKYWGARNVQISRLAGEGRKSAEWWWEEASQSGAG